MLDIFKIKTNLLIKVPFNIDGILAKGQMRQMIVLRILKKTVLEKQNCAKFYPDDLI